MALSMTGFGTAEGNVTGRHARVEVRSVNHRWFSLATRLPPELAGAEAELRESVRKGLDRGSVTVTIRWMEDAVAGELAVDWPRMDAVVAALASARERYGVEETLTMDAIARYLDLGGARDRTGADLPWAAVAGVVTEAVMACTESRRREGEALTAELRMRLDLLEAAADRIATAAPARLLRERERLRASVAALLDGRPLDEARLAQEVAHCADRVDITEELVRLRTHLAAARTALAGDGPVGKRLGFLAQELGREVNTIGSKANDAAIASDVVGMKCELEKVREQLENLA